MLVADNADAFIKFLNRALSKSDVSQLMTMAKMHHFDESEAVAFARLTSDELSSEAPLDMGEKIQAKQFAKKFHQLLVSKLGPVETTEAKTEE